MNSLSPWLTQNSLCLSSSPYAFAWHIIFSYVFPWLQCLPMAPLEHWFRITPYGYLWFHMAPNSAQWGATSTVAHLIFTKPWFYQSSSVPRSSVPHLEFTTGARNNRKMQREEWGAKPERRTAPLRPGRPWGRAFPSACDHFWRMVKMRFDTTV